MKTIVLDGVTYELKPVSSTEIQPEAPENRSGEAVGTKILEEYAPKQIKKAVPVVSEYRERYKQGKLRRSDIVTETNPIRSLPKQDQGLEGYSYKGEKLFFGEGIQQEF